MTDIRLQLSSDGTSLDWCDPSVLAQPIPDSQDVETYALMLLTTDRVAPSLQYGLLPIQRRGCWTNTYLGEFGSLFWLGTDENLWAGGSKLAQLQRWAEQALLPLFDENMIQQPAIVNANFLDNESVQISISMIDTNGQDRTITFVKNV